MNEQLKKIKSYVIRTTRMSPLQKKAYVQYHDKYVIGFQETLLDFNKYFNQNEIIIEIGFGMGDATIEIAQKNPERAYIGIEVHKPGIGKILDEIENKHINNLKIIEYNAVEVFEKMVPDKSLTGVHIFFPDPWPKKKHHKRRLIKEDFINILISKIKNEGYIYIATDWEDYAQEILEIINKFKNLEKESEGFTKNLNWRPTTKFEIKGLNKDHIIRELFLTVKD